MHIEKDCLLLQYLILLLARPPTNQIPPNSSINAHHTVEFYLNKQYQHFCLSTFICRTDKKVQSLVSAHNFLYTRGTQIIVIYN